VRPVQPDRKDSGRETSRRRSDRALINLAEATTTGLSSREVLDRVVAAAATLADEAVVHLWLVSEDLRELRLAAQAGRRPGKTGVPLPTTLPVDTSLAGLVARSRETLVLPSLKGEQRMAAPEWAHDQGVASFAGVPFALAERLLGVLCLFTRRRHRFTRYEVDLLRSFASHAALAMVYGIVSRHGGGVAVDSTEGLGSTFRIRLPRGRAAVPGRAEAAAEPGDQAARILVIDDEADVRDALVDMLREQHHEVVSAADGAEGLERFRAGTFDLVLTDLAMPGISGWQVARAVKASRPDVPIVLVTGWGVELSPAELRMHGVDQVMTKPFRLPEVLEVVATCRRRPPGAA
jgi:CheY-like chemotaxis protein